MFIVVGEVICELRLNRTNGALAAVKGESLIRGEVESSV